jgi:hypothetical protein
MHDLKHVVGQDADDRRHERGEQRCGRNLVSGEASSEQDRREQ